MIYLFCPHWGKEILMNLDILFEIMNHVFKFESCEFKIESSNYIFEYEEEADIVEDWNRMLNYFDMSLSKQKSSKTLSFCYA